MWKLSLMSCSERLYNLTMRDVQWLILRLIWVIGSFNDTIFDPFVSWNFKPSFIIHFGAFSHEAFRRFQTVQSPIIALFRAAKSQWQTQQLILSARTSITRHKPSYRAQSHERNSFFIARLEEKHFETKIWIKAVWIENRSKVRGSSLIMFGI